MAVVLVVAALLLPIGWQILAVSDALNAAWELLRKYVGSLGALAFYISAYIGSVYLVIGAAQSIGVGGQALVAFGMSFGAATLFRYLKGEDIELG